MPAAAVIPAPIAYTKIVAVKKLVVGFLALSDLLNQQSNYTSVQFNCVDLIIVLLGHHSWKVIWLLIELNYDPDQLL